MYAHQQNRLSYIDNKSGRIMWSAKINQSNTGNEEINSFNLEVLKFANLLLFQLISTRYEEMLTFHKTGIPLHFLGEDVSEGMWIELKIYQNPENLNDTKYCATKIYRFTKGCIMEQKK